MATFDEAAPHETDEVVELRFPPWHWLTLLTTLGKDYLRIDGMRMWTLLLRQISRPSNCPFLTRTHLLT